MSEGDTGKMREKLIGKTSGLFVCNFFVVTYSFLLVDGLLLKAMKTSLEKLKYLLDFVH